jgi:DNA-binding PucR family transcriptional regulator
VLRLDECWLDAVVLAEHDRLAAIFAPVTDVARAHPHLADAVTAFAASGMQVTRAAQALNLHPNSLSYRLERWGTLTGWHPRTFDGLRRSLAAIQALGAAGA